MMEGDHATGVADPGYSDLSADATNDAGGTYRSALYTYHIILAYYTILYCTILYCTIDHTDYRRAL